MSKSQSLKPVEASALPRLRRRSSLPPPASDTHLTPTPVFGLGRDLTFWALRVVGFRVLSLTALDF